MTAKTKWFLFASHSAVLVAGFMLALFAFPNDPITAVGLVVIVLCCGLGAAVILGLAAFAVAVLSQTLLENAKELIERLYLGLLYRETVKDGLDERAKVRR